MYKTKYSHYNVNTIFEIQYYFIPTANLYTKAIVSILIGTLCLVLLETHFHF